MKQNKKYLSRVFVLLIVGILIFPLLKWKYQEYLQQKILAQYKQEIIIESNEAYNLKRDLNKEPQKEINEKPIAILEIPNIKFEQIVLNGDSEENLDISVALLEESVSFGEVGKIFIAGHNSKNYGRNFNRLKELVKKDSINLKVDKEVYYYEISKVYIVAETELGILTQDTDKELLVLITCQKHDGINKRLIVEAERVKQ